MSSLGWSLVCAAPLLVSSGYVIGVIAFCFIERQRAADQIDLRSKLREFLRVCSADPSAGEEIDLTQLRETLELLDKLRETPATSPSVATVVFENIA